MSDQSPALTDQRIEVATLTERVANLVDNYTRDRTEDRAQLDRIEGQTRLTNGRVTAIEVRVTALEETGNMVRELEHQIVADSGGRQVKSRLVDRLVQAALALLAAGAGGAIAHFAG